MVAWANAQHRSAGELRGGRRGRLAMGHRAPADAAAPLLHPAAAAHAPLPHAPPSCLPGWIVLTIPPGTYRLEQPLVIERARTVLRGAGRHATTLYLPHSLMDLYGERGRGGGDGGGSGSSLAASSGPGAAQRGALDRCPSGAPPAGPTNKTNNGFYVWTGAFVTAKGGVRAIRVANLTAPAARGTHQLQARGGAPARLRAAAHAAAAAAALRGRPQTAAFLCPSLPPHAGGRRVAAVGGGSDHPGALRRRRRPQQGAVSGKLCSAGQAGGCSLGSAHGRPSAARRCKPPLLPASFTPCPPNCIGAA